jgi:6-methylsalicylate decarboxylase
VPTSHVLFGTDYNRFPISHTVQLFERLKLAPEVRRAIERDNIAALLPRWRT